jgi:hypothetical protein
MQNFNRYENEKLGFKVRHKEEVNKQAIQYIN